MAADIRIARKDAGKIGLPEVALGVLPGTGGTQRLAPARRQGARDGADGERPAADDGRGRGARARHGSLGRRRGSPAGRSSTRSSTTPSRSRRRTRPAARSAASSARVQSGLEAGFGEGLALERELQQLLFESDDAKEGIAANLEKRSRDFQGHVRSKDTKVTSTSSVHLASEPSSPARAEDLGGMQ